ncbi:MAG: membrane protein insertion efficiency factor YidD [Candidatus Deferrimicrobiaceae bacterium]
MGKEGGAFALQARDIPISFLKAYQRLVSPYLGDCCRFHPSCSEYMIGSLRLNGVLVGFLDGMRRVVRCHPFHPGGVDYPRRIHFFSTRSRCKNG